MKIARFLLCQYIQYPKPFVGVFYFMFPRNKHSLSIEADEVKRPVKLSSLYVPGRYGADMYQIVRPVICANDISGKKDSIQNSCRLRGIDVDLDNVVDLLHRLESERREFATFAEKDRQYVEEIKRLHSVGGASCLNSLKNEHEMFIEKLKSAKEKLHDTEELVLPMVQEIPNVIHPETPLQSDLIKECIPHFQLNFEPVPHVEICKQASLLKITQNKAKSYYLKGILSELELAIQVYFCNKFIENGFKAMSCVDFCKSFLIEAVGLDPQSFKQTIPIREKVERGQMLHLVGGASLESFCAYLTNMNVSRITLPMKYCSIGRRYNPEPCGTTCDLFSVVQSSNIHCLILCENTESEDEEFKALVDFISFCYNDFGIPYQIVNCSPKNLNVTESRRKQLEVWSPAKQKYIPVAHVSERGDFISKRLHVTYGSEYTIDGYCHMIESVIVNIPVLIGCIMENFHKPNQRFNFPSELAFLQSLI